MNFPSVSQFSIAKGTGGTNPPEMYIPLYLYSGACTSFGATSVSTTTYCAVIKNSASSGSPTLTMSGAKLHTLNSSWSPNQKFALEASFWSAGATANIALWDFTASAIVSGTQISTTSTSAITVRSSQVTLTPGRIYGVVCWTSNATYVNNFVDASLIVFPS